MQHVVDQPVHVEWFGNVVDDHPELGIVEQVPDVVRPPGDEVVHAQDGMPLGQEPLAQVRTDEPGPAGDERPHDDSLIRPLM
jgi:hypothetical protein